jgi:di/tricarboxylate transporter
VVEALSPQAWQALMVLGVTVLLFATDRLRLDVVALLMLLALILTGLVTPAEALKGWADPMVTMIAGLFVVGAGLLQTGAADALGQVLHKLTGRSETRTIGVLMLAVGGLSAFMSSTGTAAVFLPVALSLAHKARLSPGKLLMPISIAALLGGLLTLIATPPNLVVSQLLIDKGLPGLNFLSLTPIGGVLLVAGIAYMVLVGRHQLPVGEAKELEHAPGATPGELAQHYQLLHDLYIYLVAPGSPLIGQTLRELELPQRYQVTVVSVRHPYRKPHSAGPATHLEGGDMLVLLGTQAQVRSLAAEQGLQLVSEAQSGLLHNAHQELAEILLIPRSRLVGKMLSETQFRERYRLNVLAVSRAGERLPLPFTRTPLRLGDTLLIHGPVARIRQIGYERRDFVLLQTSRVPHSQVKFTPKMGLAVAIVAVMLALMSLEIVAPVTAVLMAAVGMVLGRCLTMEEAYRGMSWESLVLIAAMLPMAAVLQSSGALSAMSELFIAILGPYGPYLQLAGLFVLATAIGLFISNTATAVLLAPLAFAVATSQGYAPTPFLVMLAVASSTSFATPMSTPVNMIVFGPGGYRFSDFVKVGVPLQVLMLILALLMVPWLFPF